MKEGHFKPRKIEYIRVSDDYYKLITKVRANKSIENEWHKTSRQTIMDDNDRFFLRTIPKYDAFCNVPDHINYEQIIHNNFNKYYPFIHKLKKGSIKWTMRLLRHVFGEHIELGLDYVQMLYQSPTQILPILCLVSYENQTGKTTFLNWMNSLFLNNMVVIGNQELQSAFNSNYATKLIIAIDESKIDKGHVLEKIKAMATAPKIEVNSKFIIPFTIDLFAKIILCSNYEDNFINAKEEDIRYWVRKLGKPKFKNFDIEADLKIEMDAFVYYIHNRKMKTKKGSRAWFDADEIETQALMEIKKNSTETVIKHLMEYLTDKFDENEQLNELLATPTDIKDIIFKTNSRIDPSYIRRLLKTKFNLTNSNKIIRYSPLEAEVWDHNLKDMTKMNKTGKPFVLIKDDFYLNSPEKGVEKDKKEPIIHKKEPIIKVLDDKLPF